MEIAAWIIASILMLGGLISTMLPIIPGPLVILLGAAAYWAMLQAESGIGLIGFFILSLLALAAAVVDFVSGALGAKWFGASKWGAFGALLGGIIGGIAFSIPGLIVGPVIGAIAFEMLFDKKELKPAGKSGLGTIVGGAAGIAGKLAIATGMVAYFLIDVLLIDRF